MSNDSGSLAIGALQQGMARKIDPEQLQVMGKQAAALYTKTGKSLSSSVVEISKHAQLSPEQVRRVCEFANTAAYLEAFEKSGELKNVTFEDGPADPSFVLKELNDGSVPALHQIHSREYDDHPNNYKTAQAETALAEAFLIPNGLEKSAGVSSGWTPRDQEAREDPVLELYDLHCRLQDVRDQYMSKLSSCEVLLEEVKDDLYKCAKQELMDGSSLTEMNYALQAVSPNELMRKEAMSIINMGLNADPAGKDLREMGISKVGHAYTARYKNQIVNVDHPLVDRFTAFTKVAHQHLLLKNLVEVLDEQLAQVNPALRSAVDGLQKA